VHVIVPAHNEEEDLPATLVALSRNPDVAPAVVANRCDDDTAKIACRMGAVVVDQPTGRKMAATKAGIAHLQAENIDTMLFTDADTLPQPGWSRRILSRLALSDRGFGAAVFGSSLVWHGPSKMADSLMTASRVAGVIRRDRRSQPPLANGHNYGLQLDPDGLMSAAIDCLDDDLFVRTPGAPPDDSAIQQALLEETYANVVGVATLDSRVLTRGDRVHGVREALNIVVRRHNYGDVASSSYAQQYGNLPTQSE
jgi:hypothetical protein